MVTSDGRGVIHFINQVFETKLDHPMLKGSTGGEGICVGCFESRALHSNIRHKNALKCRYGNGDGSFFDPSFLALRTINIASGDDNYQLTFDLPKDDDRERLKRFLYFMEAPGTAPPSGASTASTS